MQSYSLDLRERVLRALIGGVSHADCAALRGQSGVGPPARDRLSETGERGSYPIGGHRRSRLAGLCESCALDRGPARSTPWPRCSNGPEQGVSIKVGALWHQLNQWNSASKPCTPASKSARTCKRRAAHDRGAARHGCYRLCLLMKPDPT